MHKARKSYFFPMNWKWFICFMGIAGFSDDLKAVWNSEEGFTFFENHIRPILVESCYECHSDQTGKSKGGLKLDSRSAIKEGGQSGAILIKGSPEKSLIIQAIKHLDPELKMPPKGPQLSAQKIAHFEEWIAMGAPDPRDKAEGESLIKLKAETHWAFKPVAITNLPSVKNTAWPLRHLDLFTLFNMEEKNMTPSAEADKRTWIRRAYYNLTGLPPTIEEIKAFESDESSEAYEKVVEKLLSSPHYGERWARHWMDVSRYADTKGYVFQSDRSYPFAYTYRDYLVRSFNEDLPYDRFIKEQLAADLLDLGDDKRALAALGYLTLGRRFLNNQHDIIDDRIDVVSRGLMGLTVTCARCHAHKYDPIPTEDYYSLYGVFASTQEPNEKPLLGGEPHPLFAEYQLEKKKRSEAHEIYLHQVQQDALKSLRNRAGDYLMAAHAISAIPDKAQREALARERKLDPGTVFRWSKAIEHWTKEQHPVFTPWILVTEQSKQTDQNKEMDWKTILETSDKSNALVIEQIKTEQPSTLEALAGAYNRLFKTIDQEWETLRKEQPNTTRFPDPVKESLRMVLYAPNAPANLPLGELNRLFEVKVAEKVRRLKRQLDGLDAEHPGAPARAMALLDKKSPVNPVVFKRGSPQNRGDQVPRQFLGFLEGSKRKPFTKGSGRLELAEKIAHPSNPLTARVFVNRVWAWHFGVGLVDSASDFGLRSGEPQQQGLLDYLAHYLVSNDWSIKQLQREIVLSATFRQQSLNRASYTTEDPENSLLWKFNRQRLNLEAMRDTLLKVTGQLDARMGGKPVEITKRPWVPRRSVYGYIERQNLPNFFRTFDFASPDSSSPGRFRTSVPQQALYLMNSPFMKQLVDGMPHYLAKGQSDPKVQKQAITNVYHSLFQRNPTGHELEMGLSFLDSSGTSEKQRTKWEQYVQSLLMSNELIFID
jgi:hypothetical protein